MAYPKMYGVRNNGRTDKLKLLSNFSFWQGDGYFSVLSPPVLRLNMKTIYELFSILSIKDFKIQKI